MKIYFAGSITGGRDDKDLYFEIIKKLKTFGTVLTEHIGDKTLGSYGEINLTEGNIFSRDIAWLTSADVIVAEVTTASLGVGYELGIAEGFKKKILCLYREQEGKKLSAMIGGNPAFMIKKYQTLDELDGIFSYFFFDNQSGE
jgi:nucleoside 2-deoxyribosyltransferase